MSKTEYTFEITPIGKPRMVRSDTWSGRKCVADYWLYKDMLNILAKKIDYVLSDELRIIFFMPMPESWSKKKKVKMDGTPCKSKPDIDNLIKAFVDCLTDDDSFIYSVSAKKLWSGKGLIKVQS